ncbi:bacillithiol biosynthesis deacetylase BshB1 [Flavobacteriales bacterium]|jgi:N-acetylglucosamine malate deacetylase 1|nr:bacillithiol biosynthesis deacetylase BshB1 [Flavobacteriales bacterium]MDG1518733.1 bacillithiol biosynthesis deacetylase BshB1 [Flavobacteriales bacterium]
MKLDILAFAAHPDDVELSCGGTIIKQVKLGYKVGVVDLTQGELGSRGTAETRKIEATNSSKILGLSVRENLKMADGFFEISQENKLKIVQIIRKYQPKVVFANSINDRHPDHGRASKLVSEACFLAGLAKIITTENGLTQKAYRPEVIYHYIQDYYIKPDFIVDVSDFIDLKIESVKAYKTQFFDPNSLEPPTPISGEDFFEFLKARSREFGRLIQREFGEGFTVEKPLEIKDVMQSV